MSDNMKQKALDYHEGKFESEAVNKRPGKVAIAITKACDSQHDLSLAYTPGVAEPVRAIAENAENAYRYTAKGNLVGVVTDGSAVLGLGNVGALAGKPVMEGKGVLFKKFADIDVFDIEVDVATTAEFISTVAGIAPTFGGINLEDIAAPRCFEIEQTLIDQLDIPVFHDDQHGTAIIVAAGLLNALQVQGKTLDKAKIVCLGAGSAGIASMRLLVSLGAHRDNILMLDRKGVIHTDRKGLNPYKWAFASEDTSKNTLLDAMGGADVFIGVSGANLLTEEALLAMAPRPVVFALSNPDPEIAPALAHKVRDDMVMATGRSDHPNQVNNVLGFPFIFRGALDVRARRINEDMMIAAVHALQKLAHEPVPKEVCEAYGLSEIVFGPDYIIPKPFDARLLGVVSSAVAQAAVDSGVAQLPYPDYYPPTM
jgi:malate dehydrogenase (oxaloacetate-decarboxylating)(NADP+)